MRDSNDKCIIVTGAAGGIGFATVIDQLNKDIKVIGLDSKELSADQIKSLQNHDDKFRFYHGNALDSNKMNEIVLDISRKRLHLIGLVNTLGVEPRERIENVSLEDFRNTLEVNVLGFFLPAQIIVRHWLSGATTSKENRSIVNVSSVNAHIATAGHSAYGSSKGAITQLTRVMAVELAPQGIRVNAVGPGAVRTDLMSSLVRERPDALETVHNRTPMGRIAEPSEIARPISFLLSEDASYVTGQTLFVDGGRTAQNLPS